jgi:pyrroline-5-carboxylate reductase
MLEDLDIGFIGAGNMAEAIIKGLLDAGITSPDRLYCSDVNDERLRHLKQHYGIHAGRDNLEVIGKANLIVYAVKPQVMGAVLKETVPSIDTSKVVISIAAGVPLSAISDLSTQPLRLIRAMPNVCVSVKAGATAVVPGAHAREEDLQIAQAVFNSVGSCIPVKSEELLDAVTGLSASGPAYVFLIMEALADGGVKMGLSRAEALLLSAQTLFGAAKMHLEQHTHPAQLKDMVASPGGTTIAGLHALEKGGVRGVMMQAVEAATLRARELGEMARNKAGNKK